MTYIMAGSAFSSPLTGTRRSPHSTVLYVPWSSSHSANQVAEVTVLWLWTPLESAPDPEPSVPNAETTSERGCFCVELRRRGSPSFYLFATDDSAARGHAGCVLQKGRLQATQQSGDTGHTLPKRHPPAASHPAPKPCHSPPPPPPAPALPLPSAATSCAALLYSTLPQPTAGALRSPPPPPHTPYSHSQAAVAAARAAASRAAGRRR